MNMRKTVGKAAQVTVPPTRRYVSKGGRALILRETIRVMRRAARNDIELGVAEYLES